MIDRTLALSVTRKAEALRISRGAVYYAPRPTSTLDLALMHAIDALHLDFPFAGARMLRRLLCKTYPGVGRRRIGTLMLQMGDRRPSVRSQARVAGIARIRSSLSPPVSDHHPAERRVGDGHNVHPHGAWVRLPRGGAGLGEPPCSAGASRSRSTARSASPPSRRRSPRKLRQAPRSFCAEKAHAT